jgi:ATP phosphoribosyltransferase regulatory subunit
MARPSVKSDSRSEPSSSTVAIAPPSGMRDLMPEAAAARAYLRKRIADVVALYGYEPIVTPVFELADVLERGLDAVDRRDLLRFVEPESGEVALLRPDITPQVARIVATTLRDRPAPYRLSYEGTVIRRRRGRARRQRQIFQTGGECIGPRGPDADVEVIEIAARAAEAAGITNYRIELAQVRLARTALAAVPENARGPVSDALARKDVHAIETELARAGVAKRDRASLLALAGLWDDRDVIKQARKLLRTAGAAADLDELEAVVDRLASVGLLGTIGVDLGELRGQAYYTGVSFTLLAEGPGEPFGGGGRYDRLLERFGLNLPATGFALDVDHLEWALRTANVQPPLDHPVRLSVHGNARRTGPILTGLRGAGVVTSSAGDISEPEALAYASGWGYDCSLYASPRGLRATRVADRATRTLTTLDASTIDELVTWAAAARGTSGRT